MHSVAANIVESFGRLRVRVCCPLILTLVALTAVARGQENYEIQVYSYDTVQPHHTMVELHSNFTFEGTKTVVDGALPTEHA